MRRALVYGAVVVAVAVAAESVATRAFRARRQACVAFFSELREGMPREKVDEALARHGLAAFENVRTAESVQIAPQVGLVRFWLMGLGFEEGKLRHARIRTEDGFHPSEAPPDLGGAH